MIYIICFSGEDWLWNTDSYLQFRNANKNKLLPLKHHYALCYMTMMFINLVLRSRNLACIMSYLTLAHFPLWKKHSSKSELISSMSLGCREWFFNRKWTIRAAGIEPNVNSTQTSKCWSKKCGKALDFTLDLSWIYTDFRCYKIQLAFLNFYNYSYQDGLLVGSWKRLKFRIMHEQEIT